MFTLPKPTPEQQAEIEAYWDGVRAKLIKPTPHEFMEDRGVLIDMHNFLADEHVRIAASHARKAIALAETD